MSVSIISVDNLSKRYLLGHRALPEGYYRYTALRDVVGRELRSAFRRTIDAVRGQQLVQGDAVEEFWALRDISFNVREGEVLGIIGRNGAGKSTLLKILSRITEPTSGRVILRGRVASLLEVGTGFHPELSGRENIYLNGAILGMRRTEIRKKFDEIVAFAEIDRFLDTPVKRYSSGMYVRLAFAIAAHLEPEILVIDEVLAVGDAEFQRKCLGKMNEVSRSQGRTVLFVSHNIEAVLKLCDHGILLANGKIMEMGEIRDVVSGYLKGSFFTSSDVCLAGTPRQSGFPKRLRLSQASVIPPRRDWSFAFGERVSFDLYIHSSEAINGAEIGIGLFSMKGHEIASWTNACSGLSIDIHPGPNVFRIEYEDLMLLPGQYFLGLGVRSMQGGNLDDYLPEAIHFEIAVSPLSAEINGRSFGGSVVPRVRFSKIEKALLDPILHGTAGPSA